MKFTQIFSTIAALSAAASITVGALFVASGTGTTQQDAETANGSSVDAEAEAKALAERVARSFRDPLTPDQLISDRSHDIVLDAKGGFSGHLTTFASDGTPIDASETLVKVVVDGEVAAVVRTNAAGVFSVSGLKPAVAAIYAANKSSFVLTGVRLVSADEQVAAKSGVSLDISMTANGDLDSARKIVASQLPPKDVRFSAPLTASDEEFRIGNGESGTTVIGHRVQLQADGSLVGVVHLMDQRTGRIREVLDLSIYFVRNGRVSGQAEVENNGRFVVSGLTPGIYTVAGSGKDGVFAFGVEVAAFDANLAELDATGEYRTVSLAASLDLNVAPANTGNFNGSNAGNISDGSIDSSSETTDPEVSETEAGAQGGTGGTGGGGTGGGGGGGGGALGDGLGAVIGAAAGGALGYAIGRDDRPASPGN